MFADANWTWAGTQTAKMLMQDFTCPKNILLSLSSPILLSCSQEGQHRAENQVPKFNVARKARIQAMSQNGLVVLKQLKQLFYLHHKDMLVHIPIAIPATLKSNYLLRY